ncbi:TetR/AcrR family transcriptional regulator [Amycolatopsis sp. NPDC048633]|uniref:TetR/AcrR family transcriptional regulator n=1 Tax=Amycolatopsis sp. NPDC048633 TaxID=3157095 RepID=UPI00340F8C8F
MDASNDSTAETQRPVDSGRRALVLNEIYENATRLFAERGFVKTTLNDIASALGMTRPALYHYVSSKEELLTNLVRDTTEMGVANAAAVVRRDDLDAAAKLLTLAGSTAAWVAQHAGQFRLLVMSEGDLPEVVAQTHRDGRRGLLAAFVEVIEAGIAQGEFRPVDARTAALGVLGMCNWVAWWIRPGDDVKAVSEQLAETAVAGLRRPDGRGSAVASVEDAFAVVRENLDDLERYIARG